MGCVLPRLIVNVNPTDAIWLLTRPNTRPWGGFVVVGGLVDGMAGLVGSWVGELFWWSGWRVGGVVVGRLGGFGRAVVRPLIPHPPAMAWRAWSPSATTRAIRLSTLVWLILSMILYSNERMCSHDATTVQPPYNHDVLAIWSCRLYQGWRGGPSLLQ